MNALFVLFTLAITSFCLYHGIKEDEDGKDYKLEKSGAVAILIAVNVFLAAYNKLANPDQQFWLLIYAIISMPMIYTDFQHYHLPVMSSVLYFFGGIAVLSMLATLTTRSFILSYVVAIGFFILIALLLGRLGIGVADFYVLATLFVVPLWNYGLSMSLSISLLITSLTEIVLVSILKQLGLDNFTKNIPYVPALILTIPVSIILSSSIWML